VCAPREVMVSPSGVFGVKMQPAATMHNSKHPTRRRHWYR